MEQIVAKISSTFRNQFEKKPKLYRSPGRVNLIGEHTDYNAGFVLPAAIDKMIVFAINENSNNCSRVYAHDLNESYEFSINELKKSPKGWPNYLMGVVDQFVKSGKTIGGFDCVFGGNIPIGAGMSSSAAIEAGLAMALNELFKLNMEKLPLVELARRAENEFVGVQCGIMDQFINLFGRDNQVLLLDCRSLEHNYYPFDKDHMYIVLCDTRVRRALASSEYNIRKDQCEKAVQILSQFDRSIKSLRDVDAEFLEAHLDSLEPVLYKRAKYVVNENQRVLDACKFLQNGDINAFGQLMFASHQGLKEEYEVSSPELDLLVDLAADIPGVFGARMMGAGFGGCTINLVEKAALDDFTQLLAERYREKMRQNIPIYVTRIEEGTARIAQ